MSASSAVTYSLFLTRHENRQLDCIEAGDLKHFIITKFLKNHDDTSITIVQETLKLISQSKPSVGRDRFFRHFLDASSTAILDGLGKISEIAKASLLDDFFYNVHTNKKKYHPEKKLFDIIDKFHIIASAPKISSEPSCSTHPGAASSSSGSCAVVSEAPHLSLYQCTSYGKFLVELDRLITRKERSEAIKDCIIEAVEKDRGRFFKDHEKLALAKVMLHGIFRNDDPCLENSVLKLIASAASLKNRAGEECLNHLCRSFIEKNPFDIEKFTSAADLILASSKQKKTFFTAMKAWQQSSYDREKIGEFFGQMPMPGTSEPLSQDDLETRLQRFKSDPTVKFPLSDERLQVIREQYQQVESFCSEYRFLPFSELMSIAHTIRNRHHTDTSEDSDRYKLIAVGRLAILSYFNIYPYMTQILALLGILLENKSWQAQVKTGEGKSTIIALWAFVMAMECRAPDIITSARSLAIRDRDKFADFFRQCGIVTSHICYDQQKTKHFEAQILYGPAFDFEFARMKDLLYDEKFFAARLSQPFVKRNFDCVCVDESDNLLIDTSGNSARMSAPADISYDGFYAPVLNFVRERFSGRTSSPVLPADISALKERLAATVGPASMSTITDKKVKTWIKSAVTALYKNHPDIDYVIKTIIDENGHPKRKVQIVDIKTGRISENCRWSEGIHEFVELKHDIVVEKESIMPLSISHAVFYGYYRNVAALTGTAERYQTKEIYGIESFDVPPHKPLQRIDIPPAIVQNKESHNSLIIRMIHEMQLQRRPVLVLCETIRASKELSQRFDLAGINHKTLNEMQEEDEERLIRDAGNPGSVTIATNTAGRGTDIILTRESLEAGGLHVLLTFFPDSMRVYYQAVGRAGRQGQPGTSQMVLCKEAEERAWLGRSAPHSNEEFLALLELRRSIQESVLGEYHTRMATLERHLAVKTDTFYETYRRWADRVESNEFLDFYGNALCTFKVLPGKILDFTGLSEYDLKLAENGKELLTDSRRQPLMWKMYIHNVVHRLKSKILNEWALKFYQSASNRSHSNSDSLSIMITNIDLQYDLRREDWEKYLSPDGTGILTYLKEILTLDFHASLKRRGII